MSLQLPELSVNIVYGVAGVLAAIILIAKLHNGPNLDAIPTVGSSSWLGSWWAGFKYLTNALNVIQEGYKKYKSVPFKVAEVRGWTVIISNRAHLEELARASEDEFSLQEAINDIIHVEYTLGHEVHHNPYHVTVLRLHLTRSIETLCPEIRDEIVTSFAEVLELRENEWKSVSALSSIQQIVCRTSNRAFVGLPLCRDPCWIDLNIQCTVDVLTGGITTGLFPKFMRSLVARRLTRVPQCITRGMKLLGPIIEERQKYLNEYGTEWDDKPNDLLSWLMEEAEGSELTVKRLTTRVLAVNFAAVHTTSNSFTQVLFRLAANPQYIQPLREEVEAVVAKDGWSKVALGKMQKVDSFLRECQRMEGMFIASLSRRAMKDYTFSDGTFVPKGTLVAAATLPLHYDKNFYENPDLFNPFRFAQIRDDRGPKHQFASTSVEYLAFGHGRYACPGRFFAASELKIMLAHVVLMYDVKVEGNAMYPPNWHIGTFIVANPHAKIMFRNRAD